MKQFVITLLFIVLTSLTQAQTTRPTNGTSTDVQAKINASVDGDIVTLPSGSFPWTSGVTISGKGITVRGEGAGRVEGSSLSSVAIGTGSKSFTVTNTITGFTPGETITARYKPAGTNFMTGTVTSWNGTTLVLNVTSTGGSGTRAVWNFEAPASTTLTGAGASFSITEDATHRVELTGIRFAGSAGETIVVDAGGLGVLLHDLRFTRTSGRNIRMRTNKGILWHLYMDTGFQFGALETLNASGVAIKGGPSSSWTTVSAMGTGDTTGEGKVYVEDSYFAALLTECFDFDDNARAAVRHCVFDNSGLTSHGADTSGEGNRYFEIYDNVTLFHDLGAETANMDYWFYLRGGTGVFTRNVIPDINSSEYPGKHEFRFIVQQLQRDAGPFACWGANQPGIQYPAPRQPGMGYVTGSAATISGLYVGDSEPLYIWANTGAFANPSIEDYGGTACTNPDSSSSYIGTQPGLLYEREAWLHILPVSASFPHRHRRWSRYLLRGSERRQRQQ